MLIAKDSRKRIRNLPLKIVQNCKNEVDLVCYQQNAIKTDIACDDKELTHSIGTIVCKANSSSWYPKAFHPLEKGFCDFNTPISVFNLKDTYQSIQKIIGKLKAPFEKNKISTALDIFQPTNVRNVNITQ